MAFVHTSKTRRSGSWRRGRKADVDEEVRSVRRRNDEKMKDKRNRHASKVLKDWEHYDG